MSIQTGMAMSAGLETGIIRALGRIIAWHFLTFLGVLVVVSHGANHHAEEGEEVPGDYSA